MQSRATHAHGNTIGGLDSPSFGLSHRPRRRGSTAGSAGAVSGFRWASLPVRATPRAPRPPSPRDLRRPGFRLEAALRQPPDRAPARHHRRAGAPGTRLLERAPASARPRPRPRGLAHRGRDGPGSEPFRSDYRMLGEQGRVVWVEDVTILVAADGDGPAVYQRHLLDVTRREQLEEQLRQTQRLELARTARRRRRARLQQPARGHRRLQRAARSRSLRARCTRKRRRDRRRGAARDVARPPPARLRPAAADRAAALVDLNEPAAPSSRRCSGA